MARQLSTKDFIDDGLYSRQRYMLGDNAMLRLAQSNVLVIGMNGLGVELTKNVVLAGVKSITLQDDQETRFVDLAGQFYLTEQDVKDHRNRAEACCSKLAELNPYVSVSVKIASLDMNTDLSYMSAYQCVVLVSQPLIVCLKVNQFCRSMNLPIKFIMGDVYGVCSSAFCDFGDNFEVNDADGEEAKEIFVSSISLEHNGIVGTLDKQPHGLDTGTMVTFKEVQGMTEVNGKRFSITVVSPFQFSIGDTSSFRPYTGGGIVMQTKVIKTIHFKSLEHQWSQPSILTCDLGKTSAPANIHLGYITWQHYLDMHGQSPRIRSVEDAEQFAIMAKELSTKLGTLLDHIDEAFLYNLSLTCGAYLPPLCAFLGGVLGQEVLKALTGKFTPLQQWIHLDADELVRMVKNEPPETFQPKDDRYDSLRMCLGQSLCDQLAKTRLFMVGCGAIGCEMLKNYALLGVGTDNSGLITITDNDLIEKSNLNRQFLFRPRHIRKPKSTTAAESAVELNSSLRIEAHQHKVCAATETSVFTDKFFEDQHIVVNALDNVEARRYVDSRCVTTQRALLESGTMGAKGHVQVIVPFQTESYSSQRDPEDVDVPYCTLKSFPANIEHCIQWARDKFESSFTHKPGLVNKFSSEHAADMDQVIERLQLGTSVEGAVQSSKLVAMRPNTWQDCVHIARKKFEKYYNHRAQQLLHAFPLETTLKDGSSFWQSPKRPPVLINFDFTNELHLNFVMSCARLYADIYSVKWPADNESFHSLEEQIASVKIPKCRFGTKQIVTDESVSKPASDEPAISTDELQTAAVTLKAAVSSGVSLRMRPLSFEKDDDDNGHIDFITSASNLRAAMYSIESTDRLKTKRIAGHIVPAIATTTAAIAGLVTVELLKVILGGNLGMFRNCFLNLAVPVIVFSEPGAATKQILKNGLTYTLWDRWELRSNKPTSTLADFIKDMKSRFNLDVSMVIQGSRMVYVPAMPMHNKRLTQAMNKLVKPTPGRSYVDLHVSYMSSSCSQGEEEDEIGPPVRYHLS